MSSFDIDFSNFGNVNFDKQEVRIFKISDVTIWTKYYNPKYYIGRDFGPKQGELYPRNTIIPERLKFVYDVYGTRHIVPSHHGEVFYLKQVIAIDGYDRTIESIDGSVLCFNVEKTDCLDLNDEHKTITFPYRNFYSFYFNVLFEEKEGNIFINNIDRDLYNFYPDNVLTAEAVALEGFEFDSWQLEQGPEIEAELLTQNPISFVGPASDIQISAKFRPDRSQRPFRYLSIFNRTKDYGVIIDPFNGTYKQYDIVEISSQARFGYFFKEWYSTDVVIEDISAEKITFEMPDKNVSIYASFEPYSFDVTIEDNPSGILSGDGTYKYKEQVQLTAEPINDDFAFDYWETEILGQKLKSFSSTIPLEMPAANVFAKSVFRNNIFNLKTTNYSNIEPEAKEYQYNGGREVSLSVESPGVGFAFSGWSSKDIQIDTPMSESITFEMPIKDVELDYSYERRFPNLIIQPADYGGYATGSGKKVSGNNVVINATFEDGFEFERWEIVNNVEIPNFKATDAVSVFIMPINDVILKPIFTFVTYDLVTSIIREDLSRELVSELGGPNIAYKEGPGGFINIDKNKFQARENVIITNTAQEGFIFDHYTVSYSETSYNVYDEDLVFAMPTYSVTITATFKEFLSTMTWDQVFTTAQIGSIFDLKAETWSGQEIKYQIIQGDECLIGGESGNELFIGQKEDIEIEAYIEAGEIFPKETLRRALSPEIVARTTISIKGPTSGLKIDANRSVRGISNGQVNLPSNGYNVAGVPVTIDIYDDPSLVEYLGVDFTSTQTLEDWYRLPLPDEFLKYELIPQYLSDETSGHVALENGPEAKRLKFNTPVFPASMSLVAKTQLAILWLADYTIYDVGDTTVAQASHNGADEAGNIIEFTFTIADETIASLDGSTVTFLAQGATTITLDFAGNDNYSPQSITKDLIVKKDQVITWDQDLSQVLFNQSPLALTASTDSELPVQYEIYLGALASIEGSQLTLPTPPIEGNTTITAKAAGNKFYKDAEVDIIKQIYIWDQDKDTDGDGIPDYLDEFPDQQSDTIVWDQILELEAGTVASLEATNDSGKFIHFEIIEGDTTDGNLTSEILSWSVLYLGPPAIHSQQLSDSEGAVLKIRAYTIADTEFFSATSTRILTVAAASDSDGDGIPDVDDPWKYQQADSISWIDDLSDIQGGQTVNFNATSASGKPISWEIFQTTTESTLGSSSGEFIVTTLTSEVGNTINIRAFTVADEHYFAAENERSFTIKEIRDSDGDGIPDYLDPYPFQDPGPAITLGSYLIEEDDYVYPRVQLDEQYQGSYILDWGDYILTDVNPFWNNYDPFYFATAEDGSEVTFRIEPTYEGIYIYARSNGNFDMWVSQSASGKFFQLIAETEETNTNLAGSVSIPIVVRGYDSVYYTVIDPDTGEEPSHLNTGITSHDNDLLRYKDYELQITTTSGRTIEGFSQPTTETPTVTLQNGKWIVNSVYEFLGRLSCFTTEENPLYVNNEMTGAYLEFKHIPIFIDQANNGTIGTTWILSNDAITEPLSQKNNTVTLTFSPADGYDALDVDDDWSNILSIDVDSQYSHLNTLLPSSYAITTSGSSFVFNMQDLPPRISATNDAFKLKTYYQSVWVDVNNEGGGGDPNIAYIVHTNTDGTTSKLTSKNYQAGDTVTIELKLTDDNGALPAKRTLTTDPPEFKYNSYYQYASEDITTTVVDNETIRYEYVITNNSRVIFDISEPAQRTIRINPAQQYEYITGEISGSGSEQEVYVYLNDVYQGVVSQGYNNAWSPLDIQGYSGDKVSLHYALGYNVIEDPVVTNSSGHNLSTSVVDNHSFNNNREYSAEKVVEVLQNGVPIRAQAFHLTIPSSGTDMLTVDCKCWYDSGIKATWDGKFIACGKDHTLFLNRYGEVYSCGSNYYGQLGIGADYADNSVSSASTPQRVRLPNPILWISAGDYHNVALDIYGDLFLWGRNNHGQCLQGDTGGQHRTNKFRPITRTDENTSLTWPESYNKIVQIESGKNHSVILTTGGGGGDRQIFTWGAGANGQLSTLTGSTDDQGTLQPIRHKLSANQPSSDQSIQFATSVHAGGNSTMFITSASNGGPGYLAGQNFCWASQSTDDMLWATAIYDSNGEYQLGLSSAAIGDEHVVFTRRSITGGAANEIWTAGKNDKGQLGLGNTTNYSQYYMRSTGLTSYHIAAGPKNTYFIEGNQSSRLYGCGANDNGQLNQAPSTTPETSFTQLHSGGFNRVISPKNHQSWATYTVSPTSDWWCDYQSYLVLGLSSGQFGDSNVADGNYSSSNDFTSTNGQAFNPFPIDIDLGC